MTTKDDPTLNRVFDKLLSKLHDRKALRDELSQSSLEDVQYFLNYFAEWDQHPTANEDS